MLHPTEEERAAIAGIVGIDLPTHEEMKEIEVSSRLYVENGSIYLTTPVITRAETEYPGLGVVTFILTNGISKAAIWSLSAMWNPKASTPSPAGSTASRN